MNQIEVVNNLTKYGWLNLDINKLEIKPDHKFLNRTRTLKINAKRLFQYVPEFMKPGNDILDVSCGGGATLEIIKCVGSNGIGLEYYSSSGNKKPLCPEYYKDVNAYSNYEPLLKSQNMNYKIYDCSVTPYPFKDNSFDLVVNYGAITFYGEPEMWHVILDEFKRLSKNTILLGVNVGHKWDRGEDMIDRWSNKQTDLDLITKQGSIYKWKFKKS